MYDMMDVIRVFLVLGVSLVTMLICYMIESIFLAKVAEKKGKNPLLAWIPVLNFFLLRDMARKKRHWQWLLAFLVAFLLGNALVRVLGLFALIISMMIWYWSAFKVIMQELTELEIGCFLGAVVCWPVKLYVMYKMAE